MFHCSVICNFLTIGIRVEGLLADKLTGEKCSWFEWEKSEDGMFRVEKFNNQNYQLWKM